MGAFHSKLVDMTKNSRRVRRHSPLFYKGMTAAREGRYTDAELYFHEVLFQSKEFQHYSAIIIGIEEQLRAVAASNLAIGKSPGTQNLNVMDAHRSKNILAEGQEDPNVDVNRAFLEELDATSEQADGNEAFSPLSDGTTVTGTAGSTKLTEVEVPFPVGKELEGLLEFYQLQQDVEYVYTSCKTEKAMELAMLYAQMNCMWQQISCFLLAKLRKERTTQLQSSGVEMNASLRSTTDEGLFSKKSTSTTTKPSSAGSREFINNDDVDYAVDMFEELCLHFLINSSVNYGSLALLFAERLGKQHSQDDTLTLKSKTAAERKAAAKEQQHIVKRQQRIYKNVSDLCQMLVDAVWSYCERSPDDYISKVLMKTLPPRGQNVGDLLNSLSLPTDYGSDAGSSHATTVDMSTQHALSFLAQTFKRVGSRRDGGTFLADSRALNPYMPIVIPFQELNLPMRVVIPQFANLPLSQLAKFEAPMYREAWHFTKWFLPASAEKATSLPATSSFLLPRALPQYYTEAEGGVVSFSKQPIPGRHVPSGEYVDTLLEYMQSRKASDDAAQLAALRASTKASVNTEEQTQQQPNKDIDTMNPAMRRVVLMDETAMCVKIVCILMGKVKHLQGDNEGRRLMGSTVVMQTACLRGPNSAERLWMQGMMEEMALL